MRHITIAGLLALLMLSASILSACNTMEGVGKDIEKAGQGIQNSADEEKDE